MTEDTEERVKKEGDPSASDRSERKKIIKNHKEEGLLRKRGGSR